MLCISESQLSELINHKILKLSICLLLRCQCIFRFFGLPELTMYYTDMIGHYVHDTPLYILHLSHIRLHLYASVHHFQLLHHERLQGVHVLDESLGLLHEFRCLRRFVVDRSEERLHTVWGLVIVCVKFHYVV